jgi:hypothetical protein
LVPMHPPCALNILTVIWERALRLSPGDTRVIGYCAVFKVREEAYAARSAPGASSGKPPAGRRSLKTQQHAATRASASRLAACQVRSTSLVAERARGVAAELRELERRSCRRSVPRRAP